MSDKSIEEREEQRIMRAFQAGGAKKPFKVSADDGVNVPALVNKTTTVVSPRAAAASSTAAPAATESPVSPSAAGGVPVWKQRQQQAEQETRERLEREAVEKQAAIEAVCILCGVCGACMVVVGLCVARSNAVVLDVVSSFPTEQHRRSTQSTAPATTSLAWSRRDSPTKVASRREFLSAT